MARLVSLVDFLNTGHLGPLKPGMSVREIVELLGPPKGWIPNSVDAIPPYWTYGNLEINLDLCSEPHCTWFQLENNYYMRGDAYIINDEAVMTLDGLSSESKLGDFIRKIEDIDRVCVRLADIVGYSNPTISVDDKIIINFRFGYGGDALKVSAEDLKSQIPLLNEKVTLDSIYSYLEPDRIEVVDEETARRVEALAAYCVSGREFLDAVEGGNDFVAQRQG